MTFINNYFIPIRVWFSIGYNEVSILLFALSFAANLTAVFLLLGFSHILSALIVFGLGIVILALVVCVGFFYAKYDIAQRMGERSNELTNPPLMKLLRNQRKIMERLKIEEDK